DAAGIVRGLLARRELERVRILVVLVPRPEKALRGAAAVGGLPQQVPLLRRLLGAAHRVAVAFHVGLALASRSEVTERAGELEASPGGDIREVRGPEAALRRKIAVHGGRARQGRQRPRLEGIEAAIPQDHVPAPGVGEQQTKIGIYVEAAYLLVAFVEPSHVIARFVPERKTHDVP